jgi:hypothetical protein
MDTDNYPSEQELKEISEYTPPDYDYAPFLSGLKTLWRYSDMGYWTMRVRRFYLATGGWSGNESIIAALQGNKIFWSLCWYSSTRGGAYRFHVPMPRRKNDPLEF